MKTKSTSIYDILGISSASLCLIHCIVLPLLSILPLGFTHNFVIDTFFAIIGICIAIKIVTKQTSNIVKLTFGIAVVILLTSIIMTFIFSKHNELVVLGGIVMIFGHIINFKNHNH